MLSNYPKTLSSPGFYGGYTPFSDSYLAEGMRGMLEVVKFAGVGGKQLRPANGQPVEDFTRGLDLIHLGAI